MKNHGLLHPIRYRLNPKCRFQFKLFWIQPHDLSVYSNCPAAHVGHKRYRSINSVRHTIVMRIRMYYEAHHNRH